MKYIIFIGIGVLLAMAVGSTNLNLAMMRTEAVVPLNRDGMGFIKHECCDCALTHHVELRLSDDGSSVAMYWQVDTWETKKRRKMKGMYELWLNQ